MPQLCPSTVIGQVTPLFLTQFGLDAADRLHINTVRLQFDVSGLHLLDLDYTELWGVRKDDIVAFLFQL